MKLDTLKDVAATLGIEIRREPDKGIIFSKGGKDIANYFCRFDAMKALEDQKFSWTVYYDETILDEIKI